jgi:hypothetical protein
LGRIPIVPESVGISTTSTFPEKRISLGVIIDRSITEIREVKSDNHQNAN